MVSGSHKRFSSSGYRCPYGEKLPCKRFDPLEGIPACFHYDVKGVLRFVCERFVAPVGFSVPRRLTSGDLEGLHG